MLHCFAYKAPRTKRELLEIFQGEEGAKILAGGTDLLVNIRAGILVPRVVVDIKKVEGFGAISFSATEGLVIRPAITINDLLNNAEVKKWYPLLISCGHDLASYQLRNRATVIGNVVNASPCADMAPALLCLGASAVLSSKNGERVVPFSDFFTGVKKTSMKPGEILEKIIVPAKSSGARGAYLKLKRINGHDLGLVGVALMRQDGKVRIGISSSAPTPILVDNLLDTDSVDLMVTKARALISPISDVRCSKEYREFMVEAYIKKLAKEVA